MAILDQFGRPKIATVDGQIGNPWGVRQTATLPRTVPVAPIQTKKPPAVTTVPAFQPGKLFTGDPIANVDPVVAGTAMVPYSKPQPNGTYLPDAPASGSTSGSGTGGCLLCNASPTPPVALASVAADSGSGSASAPAMGLLSASSSDVPWWLLVIGGAIAAKLASKYL